MHSTRGFFFESYRVMVFVCKYYQTSITQRAIYCKQNKSLKIYMKTLHVLLLMPQMVRCDDDYISIYTNTMCDKTIHCVRIKYTHS